ncbi:MAG: serine/threonine-protein kinase PknG [Solirubrobacteraceae bacterium]|nr:serine/threonine-protein kinase PknG [Solirubrobacteraceae bacterium]
MTCGQPDCTGQIVDGYCDLCGMAPAAQPVAAASAHAPSATAGTIGSATARARRATTARTTGSARSQLGAGLIEVPAVPHRDPSEAIMARAEVAENRRFCARCGEPVGRGREGRPGRNEGFCRKCGGPFSFKPKLVAGDVVADQYEVVGCLAHGGMGWVYLARDHNVSERWVVLKGLLNTGDDDAMAAALAERRFLAEVEHPNVVKIFNFVQHEHSGYIVMEYVGGRSLKELRTARGDNGGPPAPLPPEQAIAYMLAVLPALGHLHRSGLLFCDLKPDNVIRTQDSLKLIDLGGVYRTDDPGGPVYGTAGYQAPEIATMGPSVPSDLYTVARTLMVLCIDLKGYQSAFAHRLPPAESVPLLLEFDSLRRLLEKGTAPDPDDRFQTAEEMADQLVGVLREIVVRRGGPAESRPSTLFSADFRARPDRPDYRRLPVLRVHSDDPAAGYLATLAASAPADLVRLLRLAPDQTVEVRLRLARELIDAGDWDAASATLDEIAADDAWEWRVAWLRGIAELARGRPGQAAPLFHEVYCEVPGELAPKLALAVAFESAGDHAAARPWYEVVSRIDHSFTTAAFGLARCCLALGDRDAALEAYERVQESSSTYTESRVAILRCLIDRDAGATRAVADLVKADAILQAVDVDAAQRSRLTAEVLASAIDRLEEDPDAPPPDVRVAGCALEDRALRIGLEAAYRDLARHAQDADERVRLVDLANEVRPRTWT